MELLTKYALDGYINSSSELTIDFICGIHKNIYYWLDKVKVKTTGWEEEYMIPGQFKTKPNGISRLDTPGTYLVCTRPEEVENELQKLLSTLQEWDEYIYKKIIQFFLTFTEIHPFPDDNGKIGLMLVDLILIKNGVFPFFMSSFKQGNERRFYEMVQEYSHGAEKNMIPFYVMVAESYSHLYEQKQMADFYKESPELFIDFLRNTNEKEVLFEKILLLLNSKYSKKSPLVISDIWAGSGIAAKSIIQYMRSSKKEFQYNYLEPSKALIEHFWDSFDCSNIIFYEGSIEDVTLPKSDFIIMSHVLQYINNPEQILRKVISNLNPWWTFLIVQPSMESQETFMKDKIGIWYSMNISKVFPILQKIEESFSFECVESNIYNIQDMQILN